MKKPDLFEYINYRIFLKEIYNYYKKNQSSFSFRFFAKKCGFTSPNFLKLVIDGKRNLSAESIHKFSKALKLNNAENRFFKSLVLLNQSHSLEEKEQHMSDILKSRSFKNIRPLSKDQYDYLAYWFAIPLRELLTISNDCGDPKLLAEQFLFPVTSLQIENAINLLLRLNLIQKNDQGHYLQSTPLLSTGDEISGIAALKFHHEMLAKAQESLMQNYKQRDISAVTIAISESKFQALRSRIQQFRKELLALAESEDNPDQIYQINLQLFPLTKKIRRSPP